MLLHIPFTLLLPAFFTLNDISSTFKNSNITVMVLMILLRSFDAFPLGLKLMRALHFHHCAFRKYILSYICILFCAIFF